MTPNSRSSCTWPLQSVHSPNQAPDTYVDKYDSINNEERRKHAGMTDIMDEAVGNITKMFQEEGLWENTLTIFSTDNGGQPSKGGYNWPLRGIKGTLWEGGVRGAALVHGKMLEKTGVKCKELLHISDFYPTLINLAGGTYDPKKPVPIDGFDVWNTISRGDPSPRKEILLNIDNPGPLGIGAVLYQGMALRMGSMKLLMNVPNVTWFKPPELGGMPAENTLAKDLLEQDTVEAALYNITADPEEHNDLSGELPLVLALMKRRMQFYVNNAVPSAYEKRDPNAFKEARRQNVWSPWM